MQKKLFEGLFSRLTTRVFLTLLVAAFAAFGQGTTGAIDVTVRPVRAVDRLKRRVEFWVDFEEHPGDVVISEGKRNLILTA